MSSEKNFVVDISEWVEQARHDPHNYRERQATEILLAAIGSSSPYGEKLYLKGGTLMGIAYRSPRQTTDIDFTADFPPTHDIQEELRSLLDTELRRYSATLGYPDLVCCVQRIEEKPRPRFFEEARAPALNVTVAYAQRGTREHARLKEGKCPSVIKLEVSFNEPVSAVEIIKFDNEGSIHAYSLTDIIAEKLRALIQQTVRHRNRRQDVYDLYFLIRTFKFSNDEKKSILDALIKKAKARDINPERYSLTDDNVKKRAQSDWDSLQLEIEDLPQFEEAYEAVENFYRLLPWSKI